MLEIRNISFTAEGERKILDDISLTIPDGKLICLTGPNGGGKTTLAKVIAGVYSQTSGRILLDGQDISALDPTKGPRRAWRSRSSSRCASRASPSESSCRLPQAMI